VGVKVNGHSSEPKVRIRDLQNCFSPLTGEMAAEPSERVKDIIIRIADTMAISLPLERKRQSKLTIGDN